MCEDRGVCVWLAEGEVGEVIVRLENQATVGLLTACSHQGRPSC